MRSAAPLRLPAPADFVVLIMIALATASPVAAAPWGGDPGDPPEPAAEALLAALAPLVTGTSHPDALRLTVTAYARYRAANPGAVRKPYLYFVDFGLDNRTPRGWVLDMEHQSVVAGPFHVSHGRGSASSRNAVPARFTNIPGSYTSSLGVYLAQETYRFSGRAMGRSYTSVGLRLRGESGAFNDAARRRGIVAHGAPYVSGADAGRSEGCPAMEPRLANRLLPMLANGGVVIIYSPNDARWLREDPWVNGR